MHIFGISKVKEGIFSNRIITLEEKMEKKDKKVKETIKIGKK